MKFLRIFMLAAFLLSTPAMITACDQDGPVEDSLEEMEDSVE